MHHDEVRERSELYVLSAASPCRNAKPLLLLLLSHCALRRRCVPVRRKQFAQLHRSCNDIALPPGDLKPGQPGVPRLNRALAIVQPSVAGDYDPRILQPCTEVPEIPVQGIEWIHNVALMRAAAAIHHQALTSNPLVMYLGLASGYQH